jgi:hypothetical protein
MEMKNVTVEHLSLTVKNLTEKEIKELARL